jgi:hypothetical protein
MRDKAAGWSSASFASTRKLVDKEGSATFKGEQRHREGRGMDPLVDPRTHEGWREALTLMLPQDDGTFLMPYGVAMPIRTEADTTGSMGGNIEIIFDALPRTQNLLTLATNAVFEGKNYQVQMATGSLQDFCDDYPYRISEFEPDNEIEQQMRLLFPERDGGDAIEDYQLGMYFAAYRTRMSIVKYGLKGYYFPIGDEKGRNQLFRKEDLRGDSFRMVFNENDIPQKMETQEIVEELLKNWNTFYLQVGTNSGTTNWWASMIGRERVILLPRTELIPEVQATIIGLTEGSLDLQNALDFLRDVAKISKRDAEKIVAAVNDIPLRAQADLPNFGKLPAPGSIFASREDIVPIRTSEGGKEIADSGKTDEINWQL